jgi:hypothetical protein
MVLPTGKMKDGLVVLCPVVGCECSETVSVGGHIPDRFAVAAMRERFQRPPQLGAEDERPNR